MWFIVQNLRRLLLHTLPEGDTAKFSHNALLGRLCLLQRHLPFFQRLYPLVRIEKNYFESWKLCIDWKFWYYDFRTRKISQYHSFSRTDASRFKSVVLYFCHKALAFLHVLQCFATLTLQRAVEKGFVDGHDT